MRVVNLFEVSVSVVLCLGLSVWRLEYGVNAYCFMPKAPHGYRSGNAIEYEYRVQYKHPRPSLNASPTHVLNLKKWAPPVETLLGPEQLPALMSAARLAQSVLIWAEGG